MTKPKRQRAPSHIHVPSVVPPQSEGASFVAMCERASINPQFDAQKFGALLEHRDRELQRQARIAFYDALARAKAKLPAIVKQRTVSLGAGRNYRYEDLPAVIDAVTPVLSEHGLQFVFRTESLPTGNQRVTCILFGHGFEMQNSLDAAPDKSGAKNDVQAIGSIVTYLQRYTLKAALGIAASLDDDVTAATANGGYVSDEQLYELQQLLAAKPPINEASFCAYMGVKALVNLPLRKFADAKAAIEAKRKDMTK